MCAVTYLSFAPEGLREVFITGELPGLGADEAWRAAYGRVARRVAAHYERHPQDVDTARRVARHPPGGPYACPTAVS